MTTQTHQTQNVNPVAEAIDIVETMMATRTTQGASRLLCLLHYIDREYFLDIDDEVRIVDEPCPECQGNRCPF